MQPNRPAARSSTPTTVRCSSTKSATCRFALQAKLLRFLQERVIERVGGHQEIPVDVRVVCATHQDLPELIKQGRFREDLYYRVNEVSVRIPPLREREADVAVLARALLDKYARQHKRALRGFSPDAIQAIQAYPWPGNVRELENKINGAVILAEGNLLTAKDLDARCAHCRVAAGQSSSGARSGGTPGHPARAQHGRRKHLESGRVARHQPAYALRPDEQAWT